MANKGNIVYEFELIRKADGKKQIQTGRGNSLEEAQADINDRYGRNGNYTISPVSTTPIGQRVETKTMTEGSRANTYSIVPLSEPSGQRIVDKRSAEDIANEQAMSQAFKAAGGLGVAKKDEVTGTITNRNTGQSFAPGASTSPSGIITDNVTGNQYQLGPNGTYIPYVGKANAPTVAGQGAGNIGTTNLPTTKSSSGNISNASAGVSGMSTMLDQLMKQSADYQKQAQSLQSEQNKLSKSWLDKLMDRDSAAEVRSNALEQSGIIPAEYFADQKARITEIEALTTEYNAVKAARDQQIAQSNDKLGSMNFINNQIAQIERNAAPKLNEISANVNAKAATLQALQGNFAEARQYADQAVQDATAEQKYQFDLFSTFYQINQDQIERLDSKYQNAFNQSLQLAQQEYENAREDKQAVAELILKYYESGISINDTLDQALQKIGANPDPQTAFANANTISDNNRLNDEDGSDDIETYANSYLNEEVDITSVPSEIRGEVLRRANEIALEALSAPTPVPPQPYKGTIAQLPSAIKDTVGGFFSSLFGN